MLTGLLQNTRKEDRKVPNQTLEDVAEEVLNGMFCHYEPPNPKRNRKKSQKTKSILRRPENGRAGKNNGKANKRKGKSSNIGKSVTWSESVEGPEVSPRKNQQPKVIVENEANCSIVEVCVEAGIEVGCLSKNHKTNNAVRDVAVASNYLDKTRNGENSKIPPPPPPPPPRLLQTNTGNQFFPSICGMNCGEDSRQINETTQGIDVAPKTSRSEYESDDEEENSLLQEEDDSGDEDDSQDENEANKENDDMESPANSNAFSGLMFKPTFSTNGTTPVTYMHKKPISMKECIDKFEIDQVKALQSDNAADIPLSNNLHFLKRIWDRRRPKKTKKERRGENKEPKHETQVTTSESKSPGSNDRNRNDTDISSKSGVVATETESNMESNISKVPPSRSVSPKRSKSPKRQSLSSENDWDISIPIIPQSNRTVRAMRGRSPGRASLPITGTRSRSRSQDRTNKAKSVSPDGQKLGRPPLVAKSPRRFTQHNPDREISRVQKRRSYPDDSYQGPVDVDDVFERQSLITLHRNAFENDKIENEKENDRNDDMIERQSFIGAYRESVGDTKTEVNRSPSRNRERYTSPTRSKPPVKSGFTDLDTANHSSRSRSKSPGRNNHSKETRTVRTFNNSPSHKKNSGIRSHEEPNRLNGPGPVNHRLPPQPLQMNGNMQHIPPSQVAAIEDYYRNNRLHELPPQYFDPNMAPTYPFHNGLYYPDPALGNVYPGQQYMGYYPYYSQIQPFAGTAGLNYIVEPTHPSTAIPSLNLNDALPQSATPHNHVSFAGMAPSVGVDDNLVQNTASYNYPIHGGAMAMNSSMPPSNDISVQSMNPGSYFPMEGATPSSYPPGTSNLAMATGLNSDLHMDGNPVHHFTNATATNEESNSIEEAKGEDEMTWEERTRQAWERLRSGVFSLGGEASTETVESKKPEDGTAPSNNSEAPKEDQAPKEGKIQQLVLPQLLSPPPYGPPRTEGVFGNPLMERVSQQTYSKSTTPTAASKALNVSSYAGVSPLSKGLLNGVNQERKVTFGASQQHQIPNRADLSTKNHKQERGKKKKVLRGSKYLSGVLGKSKNSSGSAAPVQTPAPVQTRARTRNRESDIGIDRAFEHLSVSHSSDGSSQARLASILHQRNLGAKALTPTNEIIQASMSHDAQGQMYNPDLMQYWPQMPRLQHQQHPYAQFMTNGVPQNQQYLYGGSTLTPSYSIPQDARVHANAFSTGFIQNEMQKQMMEGPMTSPIYPISTLNSKLYNPEVPNAYFPTHSTVSSQYKQNAPNT